MEAADLLLLHQALSFLSSRCDGAEARDGEGFAKPDVGLGHYLAQQSPAQWEAWQQGAAWEMTQRYHTQLLGAGLDVRQMVRPEAECAAWRVARDQGKHYAHRLQPPTVPRSSSQRVAQAPGAWTLDRAHNRLILRGPYSDEMLPVLREVPTRQFDRYGGFGTPNANVFDLSQRVAEPLFELIHRFGVSCTEAAFYTLVELGEREPEAPEPVRKTLLVVRDRFVVDHPFDPELLTQCRAVQGRRFDGSGEYGIPKANTFPCVYESVAPLRAMAAAFDLEITPEASHWLAYLEAEHDWLARQAERRQVMSRATASPTYIEGLGGTLRPFQGAGVAYALDTRRTFIADEMGLGKTIEALATLEAAQAYPALVVSPASLKFNWERESQQWLPHRSVAVLSGRSPRATAEINVINYDILGRLLPKEYERQRDPQIPHFEAVVLDESQYIKNPKAQRSKHAHALGRGAPLRLCLTGTPVDNRPIELVHQLDFLGRLEEFGGFWRFVERYCDPVPHRHGWDFSGASNLGELHERLRGMCYIRRTKQDVLPELPPKQRVYVPVEISNRREYERAEKETITWLGEQAAKNQDFLDSIAHLSPKEQRKKASERAQDAEQRAARAEVLVRIEALKQVSARGKIKAVKEWIATFLESGEKLVGFAHHQEIIEALATEWNAPRITGNTRLKQRQRIVERFQREADLQLVFLNLTAGGVGLTLTAASNSLFVELGWTPTAHDQAEDRLHRIGQESSVTAWYLMARHTIDEDIFELLERKRAVVEAVTDGDEERRTHQLLRELTQRLLAKA